MRPSLPLLLLATSLGLIPPPALAAPHTTASLLLDAQQARPGDTVWAGVRLVMNQGWHTYWTFAGDSGTPTTIDWKLPPGLTAGSIHWPVPDKYFTDPFTTYVLHDEAILLVPLTLASNLPHGPLTLKAEVVWLECEELCLPGDATVQATLQVGPTLQPSSHALTIQSARAKIPPPAPQDLATARWSGDPLAESRPLEIEWNVPDGTQADFYPYSGQGYEVLPQVDSIPRGLRKYVKKTADAWPAAIAGVLVAKVGKTVSAAWEVTLQPSPPPTATPPPLASPVSLAGSSSLLLMLAFAFIGGLILNIMPCVLPVIALKVLGFVNQSKESPARVRLLGLTYGAGVLACFLALALVALAVRQAGGFASWGMVLQNQIVRVLLTIIITLVALNLFGLFEVMLSGRVAGAAGDLAAREGLSGAFFNGLLAAVLATPCTAPFMGSALTFAFTQPAAITLLVFTFLGLGLAAPFVALCWQPAWLKLIPRPGPWMVRFKVALGFPMLATAVWLFWFTAPRYGKDGVLYLGLFLVVLAAAAWTFGEFVQRGRTHRGLATVILLALLGSGYYFLLERQLQWRRPTTDLATNQNPLKHSPDGIDWQPWSPEAVAAARAAGQPVLVDFTADNCLNCKLNKVTSLEIPSTRARLQETKTVAFLGDFTDRDPRIAQILQQFQRGGVPLVLVYPPNPTADPIVLPPILTPSIVHDAIDRAATTRQP